MQFIQILISVASEAIKLEMSSPVFSSRVVKLDGIKFDHKDFLGKGGYGSVLRDGSFKGQKVAIKRIEVIKDMDLSMDDQFKTLSQLDHPNVVKLLHCEDDNDFRYYTLESCVASLGQLFLKSDDSQKYNGHMPHHVEALLQLALGLERIHSKNLIHGDIKPENVLISVGSAEQDEITLKWAYFGLTRHADERGTETINQTRDNNAWLAPEVLLLKLSGNSQENKYQSTVKSDIFAQGLVFGSLCLNGEHLYGSMENENEISGNIIHRNPVNMPKMDRKLRNCYEDELFKKMLENDPAKRMTSKEVVDQLKSIKDKLAGKEKELLRLCGRDTQLDLTEQIKNLILFGINLNAKDNDGSNALHLLCRYYSSSKLIDAIKIVIQSGINVNAKDKCGRNALHYLCRFNLSSNLIDAIQNLILAGINVNEKGNNGWNALHYLCFFHSSPKLLNAIESLIKHGINLNAEVEDGQNALHLLCQVSDGSPNFVDVIQLLIQHGIDTNAKNKNGCNALHFLCRNNQNPNLVDAIKLLIQLGVDVNAKDDNGRNGLDYLNFNHSHPYLGVALYRHTCNDAIRILKNAIITNSSKRECGEEEVENVKVKSVLPSKNEVGSSTHNSKDVNTTGKGERNALHFLCQHHSKPSLINEIKRLIEQGYNANAKDKDGWNALHYLCGYNSSSNLMDAIQILNQQRIDVNEKTNDGWNALHFLCQNNSSAYLRDAIKLLIQQGIDVNAKDKDGRNALHYLCRHNSSTNLRDAIQILFQYGIDVNEKDNDGWNALNFLVRNSMDKYLKSDVFRFLIRHGVQVHNENDEASAKTFKKLFQDFFKENENNGKKCFDFLVEEKIRLGWHDACEHCQQILSIEESPRARLWHHQMFSSCYLVFDSLMEELEKWAKSSINKFGESELDIKNPTEWLRGIAEEYQQNTTDKSYKEDFEVMADVSEQVKDGNNSSHFNCDNYERYLRSMYSIAEMTDSKESMGHIKWCYLLPFDYPIDYSNDKTSIKQAKIEWDKTLFSWAHRETDKDYGKFMTEDANDGFFLPKEFKYKCHGEL
ncbi:uncharacterized protein LOC123474067 [Daphnia magna]|uniref:uncharacterized protein LOC123474067 n=1 Tax=Daphnia magna TaxID=35525 RepID=UPI001E1BC025|nr:uncharacterized protein LOC123474067 [Daphnia magna]